MAPSPETPKEREVTARKHDGSERKIAFTENRDSQFAFGSRATVHEVTALFPSKNEEEVREHPMIIKRYREEKIDNKERQLENYALLKKLGFTKIPTTMRDISESELLITDLNRRNTHVALSLNKNIKAFRTNGDGYVIEGIQEGVLEKALFELAEELKHCATEVPISIYDDSFFIVASSQDALAQNQNVLDYVDIMIGDLDEVDRLTNTEGLSNDEFRKKVYIRNINNAYRALRDILNIYLSGTPEVRKYQRVLQTWRDMTCELVESGEYSLEVE